MPSVIACPSCQKQLKVPDELIGRNVKCPGCKETFMAQVMGGSSTGSKSDISDKPRKKPAPPPEEEEEDEAPRKRAKARDDDDADDDADVEERPSKRIKKRSGGPMAPHRGVLILILGVGALVGNFVVGGLALFLGPVAWYLGNIDLKEIDAGRMDPEGRQFTLIGKICGIIATVLLILSTVGVLALCILYCVIGGALIGGGAAQPHH